MTRAADVLVESLVQQGVDRLFCVPGESYLSLLDALKDANSIETVACRHEGGAGFMALADGKLTGRPGVVAVSRGPGATNVSIAIHSAEQDAVPLVVLIGQVARFERGRGAFQEVDYEQMFGGIAKGVWEVQDADRLAEATARAFQRAQSGTPGPVVLVLPEDMLGDETAIRALEPLPTPAAAPGDADIAATLALLEKAERPVIIAGGALTHGDGRAALAKAADRHGVPVVLSFKRQELFDNASPLFAGYLGFKIPKGQIDALKRADLVLAVGTRLGDVPTQGYSFPSAPEPEQPLVHVYPDPMVIGGVFRTALGVACDASAYLKALAAAPATGSDARSAWAQDLHGLAAGMARYEPREVSDGVDFGHVALELAKTAPKDSLMVTDAGNFSGWLHRVWPWDGTQLCVGAVGGAMGMGMPGAVAASLRFPDRTTLCFLGDGGALMTGNELATAAATGAKPKVFISNNGSYGTIRLHQERDHPRRIVGTDLANPDFAAWGRAFGALGLTISNPEDVATVCAEALAHDGPVVVDVKSSLESISAYTTVTALRGDR